MVPPARQQPKPTSFYTAVVENASQTLVLYALQGATDSLALARFLIQTFSSTL